MQFNIITRLRQCRFGSVDDIDALVGGLAEDHVPNASVGPLWHKILSEQFARMRDGDRFWYGQSDEKYGLGDEATKLLEGITTQVGTIIGVFVRLFYLVTMPCRCFCPQCEHVHQFVQFRQRSCTRRWCKFAQVGSNHVAE